jgi:hypothetical protein
MTRFQSREEYEAWKAQQAENRAAKVAPTIAPPKVPAKTSATAVEAEHLSARRTGTTQKRESDWEWRWDVSTDSQHTVLLSVTPMGRETVFVDDGIVSEMRSIRLRTEHNFEIGPGYRGVLSIRMNLTGTVKCQLMVNGQVIPTSSVPSRGFGVASIFPSVGTLAGARMAATQGTFAAAFMAIVTAVVGMLSGGGVRMGALEVNPWLTLLEAFILAGMALGIQRMLRSVAVIALVYYIINRVILVRMSLENPDIELGVGAIFFSLLLLIGYVNGVRGTFAYRGMMDAGDGRAAWTPPRPRETAIVVGAFALLLIVGSFFWTRAQRRAKLERDCEKGVAKACLEAATTRGLDDAQAFHEKACRANSAEGCLKLIGELQTGCNEENHELCMILHRIYMAKGRKVKAKQIIQALCENGDATSCERLSSSRDADCQRGDRSACAQMLSSCRGGQVEACQSAATRFSYFCHSKRRYCTEHMEVLRIGCEIGNEYLCRDLTRANERECKRGSVQSCLAHRPTLEKECSNRRSCYQLIELDLSLCGNGLSQHCEKIEQMCSLDTPHACVAVQRDLGKLCAQDVDAACVIYQRYCVKRARETTGYSLKRVCSASHRDLGASCKQGHQGSCGVLRSLCNLGVDQACAAGEMQRSITITPGR